MIVIDAKRPEGNAWAIIAAVSDVLRQLGQSKLERNTVRERMMEGDYRNLCAVAEEATGGLIKVVNLDGELEEDEDEE
jgi:hypothetical protein